MKSIKKSAGFTLIELMISVSIVGTLASMAVPVFESTIVRAKVSDGILAAAAAKNAVTEYFSMNGTLPPGGDNDAAGFSASSSSRYIDSVDWHIDQRIEIEFNEAALGLSGQLEVQLDPEIISGRITWRCGQDNNVSDEYLKYVPSNCRERYWP